MPSLSRRQDAPTFAGLALDSISSLGIPVKKKRIFIYKPEGRSLGIKEKNLRSFPIHDLKEKENLQGLRHSGGFKVLGLLKADAT